LKVLFVAHGSPGANAVRALRCANALAHASTLAENVKRSSKYFFRQSYF